MSSDNSAPKLGSACNAQRRYLLKGMAAAAGLAVLGGCASSSPEPAPLGTIANPLPATPAGEEFSLATGELLTPGSALAFVLPDESPGLVFRTAEGELGAVSALCTHAKCIVQWQISHELLCPCHGSRFALDGSVLNGPAEAPLTLFRAREKGGQVFIEAAGKSA